MLLEVKGVKSLQKAFFTTHFRDQTLNLLETVIFLKQNVRLGRELEKCIVT